MADWRKFNASNEEGTCLWCGRTLRYRMKMGEWIREELPNGDIQGRPGPKTRATKAGDYEDDQFCGLRCGMQFAWQMADLGERLRPVEEVK